MEGTTESRANGSSCQKKAYIDGELSLIKKIFNEEREKNEKGGSRAAGSLISRSFWMSDKMNDESLTNQDRYLMLYLMTNTYQNMIGCFLPNMRKTEFETHLNRQQIHDSLDRLKAVGAIEVSSQSDEVMIYDWLVYSIGSGGATNVQRMLRDANSVRDRGLLKKIYQYYTERFERLSATTRTFIRILGERIAEER